MAQRVIPSLHVSMTVCRGCCFLLCDNRERVCACSCVSARVHRRARGPRDAAWGRELRAWLVVRCVAVRSSSPCPAFVWRGRALPPPVEPPPRLPRGGRPPAQDPPAPAQPAGGKRGRRGSRRAGRKGGPGRPPSPRGRGRGPGPRPSPLPAQRAVPPPASSPRGPAGAEEGPELRAMGARPAFPGLAWGWAGAGPALPAARLPLPPAHREGVRARSHRVRTAERPAPQAPRPGVSPSAPRLPEAVCPGQAPRPFRALAP